MTLALSAPATAFELSEQFDESQYYWVPEGSNGGFFSVRDGFEFDNVSMLTFWKRESRTTWHEWAKCANFSADLSDPYCGENLLKSDKYHLSYVSFLPVCDSKAVPPCIMSISLDDGANRVQGKFLRYSHPEVKLEETPKRKIPGGQSMAVFAFPDSKYRDIEFVVRAQLSGKSSLADPSKPKLDHETLVFDISPYVMSESPSIWSEGFRNFSGQPTYVNLPFKNSLWAEGSKIAKLANLPEDIRLTVKLKLKNVDPAWVTGQFKDVSVTAKNFRHFYLLTVDAAPAKIQGVAFKTVTPGKSRFHKKQGKYVHASLPPWQAFEYFSAASVDGIKAAGKETVWRFTLENISPYSPIYSCSRKMKNVIGASATNAPIFSSKVPSLTRGFLSTKIAGLPFEEDGITEPVGYYSLSLNESFAKCVYKVEKISPYAKIEVLDQKNGSREISTQILTLSEGFLSLNFRNFNFGLKEIRVGY